MDRPVSDAAIGPSAQAFPGQQLVVGTDTVAELLGDAASPGLHLVEVTAPGTGYVLGHLAGAVYLDLNAVLTGHAPSMPDLGTLGPLADVAAVLGQLGLAPQQRVVVYDEIGGTRAAQAFWLLDYLGFQQVSVLEGGIERWLAEGRPLTRRLPDVAALAWAAQPRPERLATADWIAAQLHTSKVCLLDCRTAQEFAEGHISGARHRPWDRTLVRHAYQSFRESAELQAEFAELGATPDRDVVTYCQTGARSAHTYLTLRLLGYPRVRNYPGSWAEWGARPELPKA